MVYFILVVIILMYIFNIYVFFTQVMKDQSLRKQEKLAWGFMLIVVPFVGLYAYNYTRSRLKNKNIFRY